MLPMTSVWLTLRADLRRRWRPLLGLALLLGLVGGVVLTAAAGARRTETAYPRLLSWASAAQVDLIPQGTGLDAGNTARTGFYPALRKLPQVASMDIGQLYQMVAPVSESAQAGRGTGASLGAPLEAWSSPDGSMGITADRVKVLSGRLFDPAKPAQAMVDQRLAALEHLAPGGTLHVIAVPNDGNGTPARSKATPLDFTVTAVVAFDNTIVPTGQYASEPGVLLSPAFSATALARETTYGDEAAVRLKPGASMNAFIAAAQRLVKPYRQAGRQLNVVNRADQVAATDRAIRPQAIALGVFALLTAAIVLAIIGQLLSRQLSMESTEFPVLRAMGATRPGLCALSLARLAAVTVTGAVIAVCVATAASPLMPIGPARLAEPHPGVEMNLAILGAGGAAIALLPLILLAPAVWLAAARARGPLGVAEPAQARRPSWIGTLLGKAGSVPGGVGVTMAFEPGRGRTAVPVRSAIAGSVIAVAALATAAVFGSSLLSLVGTPHAYGKNWDQMVDLGFGQVPAAVGGQIAGRLPSVIQYADGNYGQLTIGGVNGTLNVTAVGIDPVRGDGFVTVLAGRTPRNAGEIALGAQTLRQLHAALGQSLRVSAHMVVIGAPVVARTMRVVGEVVLPDFARGTFPPTDLGTGAVTTAAAISEHNDPVTGCMGPQTCYSFFLLRYRPGTDITATSRRLSAALTAMHCPVGSCAVSDDQRPGEITQYASIRDTPIVLAAVLIVLAVGTLAHVLLTSVRRRRRDLAMLKTLGLTRPQILRVVAWQATALVAASLVVGLPLGVLAGRQAWTFFADAAGVASQPDVPLPLILLAVPVTVLLANLIAAWPGWTAARLRPAVALRTE